MRNRIITLLLTISLIIATTIISIASDDHGLMCIQPTDEIQPINRIVDAE